MRACGEDPSAAESAGIDALRTRFWAVVAGGAIASLGGVYLSLAELDLYSDGMTAGRGFIALAAVIFGRWTPLGATGAALFFGFFAALQYSLQRAGVPSELMQALPYLAALVALAGFAGRVRAPAADGVPYVAIRAVTHRLPESNLTFVATCRHMICTMRVPRRLVAAVVLLAVPLAGVSPAGATGMAGPLADFQAQLSAYSLRAPGHVGIAIEDLRTGETTGINAGTEMPAASTIKIPVMVEVFRQLLAGKFDLNTADAAQVGQGLGFGRPRRRARRVELHRVTACSRS